MLKLTIFKAVLYFLGTFCSGFAPVILTAKDEKELIAGCIGCLGAAFIGLRGFLDKSFAQDAVANPEAGVIMTDPKAKP